MSLLAFSKVEESPDSDVMEYSKRHQLATEINDEILEKECSNHGIPFDLEKKLLVFIKAMFWSQKQFKIIQSITSIEDLMKQY